MKPHFAYFLYSLIILFVTFNNQLFGQTFERAEIVSGLGILEENNGVAVADYDGDLDLDIFVVAKAIDEDGIEKSHSRLFRNNNNGSFTDATQASGLINLLTSDDTTEDTFAFDGFKFGVSWADYDNDGFPDIFFTHALKVQLFRNLGNGTFIEVTTSAGFNAVNDCINTGATWFDYNNDGFLDIYISDWDECDSNSLYKNNGNGTFQNVTITTGVLEPDSKASYTPFPFDFNNDGWMDLYVTNDFDKANYLYINQVGTSFNEDAQNYGLDNMIDDMGITISDFDNDGDFDFFITGIDENALLENDGNNNFIETSLANNLPATGWAWGTRFADFDLDGDEDLFIVNGFEFQDRNTEPNFYFKNLTVEGFNGFLDVSDEVNLDDLTISVETVDFDYDNDGDLDLFVTNSDQSSFFYENKLLNFDEENTLHWFKVSLQGTISNRDGIGTELTLTTNNGSIKRYYSGVGFISQSLQPVHFGLNAETQITQLTIKWPSGLIETHQNLDADTIIKATEGEGYVILDIQPSIKIYGCTDPESCSYNPDATLDDGSCTYLLSSTISGNTDSAFLKTEIYSYPLSTNATANWQVVGGELLTGQGTNSITVKWHLEESGRITVRENDGDCLSLEVSLNVNLEVSELVDDVSIARLWNEALLEAIRGDFARPTIHARNLFHTSIAMYDAWAIYDEQARPYLIGNEVNGFSSELLDFIPIESISDSRKKAISYATYRLLSYRFQNSPSAESSQQRFNLLMEKLGYETELATSTLYQFGNAAALGNYIAEIIINYGSLDGSRESSDYDNLFYEPINPPMAPESSDTVILVDPNRWQPLSFDSFIDQSGNVIGGVTPDFLSPEWGNVWPFAMQDDDKVTYQRSGNSYSVYNDPSDPPYLDTETMTASSDAYKWGFSLVSVWSSHLDPNDGVLWDISPKSIGNIASELFPETYQSHPNFYNLFDGGDISVGRNINPITNNAYETQTVPRGDYARVLAEFWADGPDSETPPGHWFTILNYINDNPLLEKKFAGQGNMLSPLEWDVKTYFILGGAMHDSAISSWSIKGWYDFIRPISAIRYMASKGQSSDTTLDNYNVAGIPLIEDYIEVVEIGDPLAGNGNQHVGKIKVFAWKGPNYISNPDTDEAGVDWILVENWWPYQRSTFVTPPFAGYVSGHSTYSRAAAEVLTLITGDEFFPGGLGEFIAKQNEFLVFEEGPSVDVKLQWATYRDASDQCSLSRIWGGIHPPADDIPGRLIGEKIGIETYNFAVPYFNSDINIPENSNIVIYPNPIINRQVNVSNTNEIDSFDLFDLRGRKVEIIGRSYNELSRITVLKFPQTISSGLYMLRVNSESSMVVIKDN